MSALSKKVNLPNISVEDVKAMKRSAAKPKVIFLRVPPHEHQAVQAAASSLELTVTEYLLKCHELVSAKLKELPDSP